MPAPPEGEGPVLEWFQDTRLNAFMPGVVLALVVAGFLTLRDWGVGWMGTWWLWLFVVPYPLVFFVIGRRQRMAAGADWFSLGGDWVKTYELISVRVTKAWGSDNLDLVDAASRKVSAKLTTIQQNRELWDLVYNGILHSASTGRASANQQARDRLRLPGGTAGEGAAAEPLGVEQAASRRSGGTSRAAGVTRTVLMILLVTIGSIAVASAVLGASGGALSSGSGIAGVAFLAAVGIGLLGVFVWLWRRLER